MNALTKKISLVVLLVTISLSAIGASYAGPPTQGKAPVVYRGK